MKAETGLQFFEQFSPNLKIIFTQAPLAANDRMDGKVVPSWYNILKVPWNELITDD